MSRQSIRLYPLLIALILSWLSMLLTPDWFQSFENTLNDVRMRAAIELRAARYTNQDMETRESRIVIIDIDERSLAEQGKWPWSRQKLAQLMQVLLDDYAVSGAALDIVLPDAKEHDALLAVQMQRSQVTGAFVYDLERRSLPTLHPDFLPSAAIPIKIDPKAPRILGLPALGNHTNIAPHRIGHITAINDTDGAIRQLAPVICNQLSPQTCHPLLELSAFAGLLQHPNMQVRAGSGWLSAPWELLIKEGEEHVVASIPMSHSGTIVVPYHHSQNDWVSFSATDILQRRVNAEVFRGSMVLIGSTSLGVGDIKVTPISPVSAGVLPHAEVLSAVLNNDFIYTPKNVHWLGLLLLCPFVVLLYWFAAILKKPIAITISYPVWMLITWSASIAIAMWAYLAHQLLLWLTPLVIFPFLAVILCILFELYHASWERLDVLGLLSAYLPKRVAERLVNKEKVAHKRDVDIDAAKREVTVLFADIRGFTGIVETYRPEIIASLMHRVFSEMASSVVEHHGTVDKFIGDAVMAFWNAPDDDEDHARHAFLAARDIQKRIAGLDGFCRELGIAPITVGIGIESGIALVGSFGSEHRRTYTALGETVVLASRIEAMTVNYQQDILIGENCANHLRSVALQCLGQAMVRGRQRPVHIYAPIEQLPEAI